MASRAERYDVDAAFPERDVEELREEGLLGLMVPARLGGMGAGYEEYVRVAVAGVAETRVSPQVGDQERADHRRGLARSGRLSWSGVGVHGAPTCGRIIRWLDYRLDLHP